MKKRAAHQLYCGVGDLLTTEEQQVGPEGRTGGSRRDTANRRNFLGQKRRRLAGCPDLVRWQRRRRRHCLNSEWRHVNTLIGIFKQLAQ